MPPSTRNAEPLAEGARWGPFVVVRCLKSSPFAAAYEALDPHGARVHLKIFDQLRPGTALGQTFARAQRAAMPRLRRCGKGVSRILTFDTLGDRFVKSCEWVEGRPLLHCYAELTPARSLVLAQGLARTVATLHELDIGHRDLAPTNLLLCANGLVVVDFDGASAGDELGHPLSAPPYAAPEHHGAVVPRDPRSGDVFTMGVVIYELLTGWFPWAKEELFDGEVFCAQRFLATIERGTLPLARDLPDAPPALSSILQRCVDIDPARRPSAMEVSAVLAKLG